MTQTESLVANCDGWLKVLKVVLPSRTGAAMLDVGHVWPFSPDYTHASDKFMYRRLQLCYAIDLHFICVIQGLSLRLCFLKRLSDIQKKNHSRVGGRS